MHASMYADAEYMRLYCPPTQPCHYHPCTNVARTLSQDYHSVDSWMGGSVYSFLSELLYMHHL